jgi:hypothetical protein
MQLRHLPSWVPPVRWQMMRMWCLAPVVEVCACARAALVPDHPFVPLSE